MVKGNQRISFVVLYCDDDVQYLDGLIESLPRNTELILVKTVESETPKVKFYGTRIQYQVLICDYEINYIDFNLAHFRNVAKSFATCEWIVSLDADERISLSQVDIDMILKQPQTVGGLMVSLISFTNDNKKGIINTIQPVRIFRKQFNWNYIIHEQILEDISNQFYNIRSTDIMIRHIGYASPEIQLKKLRRNLPLICKQMIKTPTEYMEYKLWQTANALMQVNQYFKDEQIKYEGLK